MEKLLRFAPAVVVVSGVLAMTGCAHTGAASAGSTPPPNTTSAPSTPEPPVTLQRYQSPSGYSVMLPTPVQTRERTEQTLGGPVVTKLAEAKSASGNYVFSTSVTALPQLAVNTMSADGLLQTAQKSAIKELDGKLNTQRELHQAGLAGREFTVRSGKGDNVIGRVLLDGGNLYSLLFTYPSTNELPPAEATKFLDSFQH